MNLPQDVLIDAGLTVAGYVVAGLIAIVIYSMFSRKHRAEPAGAGQGNPQLFAALSAANREVTPSVEFVRLGDERRPETVEEPKPKMSLAERRNIVETIKKTLPISDAELALLRFEIER